jgi:phosphoribosylpyrophosphate synthetase
MLQNGLQHDILYWLVGQDRDRKDKPRVPIGAKLTAKLIETAGATRVMTMDLHADQIKDSLKNS